MFACSRQFLSRKDFHTSIAKAFPTVLSIRSLHVICQSKTMTRYLHYLQKQCSVFLVVFLPQALYGFYRNKQPQSSNRSPLYFRVNITRQQ
jgi:hypothetical protein